MSDKNERGSWFWHLVFVLLVGFAAWQVYENHQLERGLAHSQNAPTGLALMEEVVRKTSYELSFSGQRPVWPEGLEILGEGHTQSAAPGYAGPQLLLAVDELSCNTCRDAQTRFVLEIAREVGPEAVHIVVHAGAIRFARAYMRLNQIDIPVYFDAEGSFFKENGIAATPMLMLLDGDGTIDMAHYPIAGKELLSEPFHEHCRRRFR